MQTYQIGDQVEIIGEIQGWKGRIGVVIFTDDRGDLKVECGESKDDCIVVMNREVKHYACFNVVVYIEDFREGWGLFRNLDTSFWAFPEELTIRECCENIEIGNETCVNSIE